MKRVMLDAGHGQHTAGKRTPDGIREWRLNQTVVSHVAALLKGYDVEIRHANDVTGVVDTPLATRIQRLRDFNPHLFVSVHHNAHLGTWGTATGTEVFVHNNASSASRNFADILAPRLSSRAGLRNRGVKTGNLAVLDGPKNIPAVLAEGGFMDTRSDHAVITSDKGQRAYASAIADSVVQFLGLRKVSNTIGGRTHKVVSGDTLFRLAQIYGTTVAKLQQANGMGNSTALRVGQMLQVPPATNQGIAVGSRVRINNNAQNWATGQQIPSWARGQVYGVVQVRNGGNEFLLSGITSWIRKADVTIA